MLYVVLSCLLLFSGNSYQQSIYLTSAGAVSSSVYGLANGVSGYFNLRSINDDLQHRNAALANEVLNLKSEIAALKTQLPPDSAAQARFSSTRFDFVMASVINNSTVKPCNYFTIDAGASSGIKPGMGVVDHNGMVGIVNVVGKNTARVISVLHVKQKFSVKVKGTSLAGSLIWKEGNPAIAYIEEMPRHVNYHVGDTIVTSGYSTSFPEGIPVGYIMGQVRTADDNFFTLKVRLASEFSKLSTVRIIKDDLKAEMDSLTQFDDREDQL